MKFNITPIPSKPTTLRYDVAESNVSISLPLLSNETISLFFPSDRLKFTRHSSFSIVPVADGVVCVVAHPPNAITKPERTIILIDDPPVYELSIYYQMPRYSSNGDVLTPP